MTRRLACLALLLAAGTLAAQDQTPPLRVALHPQGEPVPALKYQLLPTLDELRPGNAAVYYHRAFLLHAQFRVTHEQDEKEAAWLEMPLRDLPREEVRQALARYANVLHEIDLAARRLSVDWELESRTDGFDLMLPEMQGARSVVNALALKARFEIAEHEYDAAVHTLQDGFAMARHVGKGPTLVQGLVGLAIADVMVRQVESLIQQPGAPNLYWALTSLPRPLVDLREALQGEKTFWTRQFPQLRRLLSSELTAAQVNRLVDEMLRQDNGLIGGPRLGVWEKKLLVTAWTARSYPQAKRFLRAHGRTAEQVEAMPALQAVVVYWMEVYERLADEALKWFYVPYWQARRGFGQAVAELSRVRDEMEEGLPVATLAMPAVAKIAGAAARRARTLAALRVIEALRLYAAAHDGALPAALKEITAVPVPIDPMTGRDFGYALRDGTAALDAPAPPGESQPEYHLRYELTVAR